MRKLLPFIQIIMLLLIPQEVQAVPIFAYFTDANEMQDIRNICNEISKASEIERIKEVEMRLQMEQLEKQIMNDMIAQDAIFDTLSSSERASFIRFWVSIYADELGYRMSGDSAVAISIFETNLGRAGVGRSKNNLFGCKVDETGVFNSSFPAFSTHRQSCKAIVQYHRYYGTYSKWAGKSSGLGRN